MDVIFSAGAEIYKSRGFQRKLGFGVRPALVNIDLANAWTQPDGAFACDNMDDVIGAVQRLLLVSRKQSIPVIFTSIAYAMVDGDHSDMGLLAQKVPIDCLKLGSDAVTIDSRVAPRPDELVVIKKNASAFHGTFLSSYLHMHGVDTVIFTGVTMAGCVRHTVEDAIAEGFRPIVVREAVSDRIPGATEWNLFDIDAKFGDVESLSTTVEYLERLK